DHGAGGALQGQAEAAAHWYRTGGISADEIAQHLEPRGFPREDPVAVQAVADGDHVTIRGGRATDRDVRGRGRGPLEDRDPSSVAGGCKADRVGAQEVAHD